VEAIYSLFSLLLRNLLGNLDLVLLLASYYLISYLVKRRAANQGMDAKKIGDLSFWVGVGAVMGGRLAYATPAMGTYLAYPFDLIQINTGMYFYGALAGGLAVGAWYTWRRDLVFWRVADLYGLYVPLAIALTRFGCLLRNACYGQQAPPPLGILFPGLTEPRYPSELYEGLLALLVFGGLTWLSGRNPQKGTLFLTFLVGYPLARALVDVTRIELGSQIGAADPFFSMGVAMAAVLFLVLGRRIGRDHAGAIKNSPQVSGRTGRWLV